MVENIVRDAYQFRNAETITGYTSKRRLCAKQVAHIVSQAVGGHSLLVRRLVLLDVREGDPRRRCLEWPLGRGWHLDALAGPRRRLGDLHLLQDRRGARFAVDDLLGGPTHTYMLMTPRDCGLRLA